MIKTLISYSTDPTKVLDNGFEHQAVGVGILQAIYYFAAVKVDFHFLFASWVGFCGALADNNVSLKQTLRCLFRKFTNCEDQVPGLAVIKGVR